MDMIQQTLMTFRKGRTIKAHNCYDKFTWYDRNEDDGSGKNIDYSVPVCDECSEDLDPMHISKIEKSK